MRKSLFVFSTLCLLATACQSEKPAENIAVQSSPAAPIASPAPVVAISPTPTPTAKPTPVVSPTPPPVSSVTDIDTYLSWFVRFAQKRANENTAINRRTRQIAGESGRSVVGGISPELKQSLQDTVTLNKKLAKDFAQEKPPAECAELARLFGDVLNKSIVVMELKLWNIEHDATQSAGGSTPGKDAPLDLSTSFEVREQLEQVNAQINRLYKKHPPLQTPRLILTQ